MAELSGKIAWLTGAGTGIGLSGAQELAAAGAHVVLSGRRADVLETAVAGIKRAGGSAETAALDVSDRVAVARLADDILKRHKRVDILVNSAGTNIVKRWLKDLTAEAWEKMVAINLNGAAYTVLAVLPAMRAQKDGVIINISSWAGRYSPSRVSGPSYSAAKHAMVDLTMSINREECVHNIRACVICPGEVATPILENRPVKLTPEELARMLQSEDLGRTIRFVATAPARVCFNEIVMSPSWNRGFVATLPT
ncbi:MAG TPA: SDR family oxidoreductase [Candidatus Sulfotelmatobacter sp.]|nr:SDR family oxidoreductase [Candidatus Sulfotelmatobacter sp.]